jgi:uncharacterized protein (TIGR03083 family)
VSVSDTRLLKHAEHQGRALAAIAANDGDASLPSCPDWRMSDLLAHVGTFASQFLGRMDGAPTNGPWSDEVPVPGDRGRWFGELHGELLALFRANDAAEWGDERPAPWLSVRALRRWTHELSIHRWDAEVALGDAAPIPSDLAADGIEEFIERFLAPPFWRSPRSGRRLSLTTDEASWTLSFDGDAAAWTSDPAAADTAVHGSPSELNLFLWGRMPLDQLMVTGDRDVVRLLSGA